MSSSESSSSSHPPPAPAEKRHVGSLVTVALSLGLLALLVWAMLPARGKLQPAPLRPVPADCPKDLPNFVPSDATEIPGLDPSTLSKEQRNHILFRLNMEPCPCGCNLSIAACRINHPACSACKEAIAKILTEERNGVTSLGGK